MNKELISVVIPTYKRYDELLKALDSVKKQTYPNLEVIIVDDNEDFKLSKKIEKTIKKEYKDYIYVKNEHNLGGSETRNRGIELSKGNYISFLDDDDEYYPTKIEEQYNMFVEKGDEKLALVYCYGDILYPNGKTEKERTCFRGKCLVDQMKGNIAGTSFWLAKKDALVKVGGFTKIHSHQDGVVLLKLLANSYIIDLVEKDLVKYHFHSKDGGITSINDKIVQADIEYFELCKSYFNLLSKKQQRSVILKYYDDRNFNLVILNRKKEIKEDIKYLFKKYLITKTLLTCIYRFIFRKQVCKKETKFDREVLLSDSK